MKLFHFCSRAHLAGIVASKSICKGRVPLEIIGGAVRGLGPSRRNPGGVQWLTSNDDWNQSWTLGHHKANLPFRRTERRITIIIPTPHIPKVVPWPVFCQKHAPSSMEHQNFQTDWTNWSLFFGPIPTSWFLAIDNNPTPAEIDLPQ